MKMFHSIAELISYHGNFTDTYCWVIQRPFGYDLYFQSYACNPMYDEYYYKISGDIKFENLDWDDEDDGIRLYQIWDIEPKGEKRYEITFDIGSVDMIYNQVEILPLTKAAYYSIDDELTKA